jgi:hypothetical protein
MTKMATFDESTLPTSLRVRPYLDHPLIRSRFTQPQADTWQDAGPSRLYVDRMFVQGTEVNDESQSSVGERQDMSPERVRALGQAHAAAEQEHGPFRRDVDPHLLRSLITGLNKL